MAEYFSDYYAPFATDVTALDTDHKNDAGLGHSRMRYARLKTSLSVAVTAVAPDVIRLKTVKSSDRINAIFVSSTGASTVFAANLGIYLAGLDHDGAVVDADLFASALALNGGLARVESFAESAVLTDEERGDMLWELLGLTEDPKLLYDLAWTVTGAVTTATEVTIVELFYTAGD